MTIQKQSDSADSDNTKHERVSQHPSLPFSHSTHPTFVVGLRELWSAIKFSSTRVLHIGGSQVSPRPRGTTQFDLSPPSVLTHRSQFSNRSRFSLTVLNSHQQCSRLPNLRRRRLLAPPSSYSPLSPTVLCAPKPPSSASSNSSEFSLTALTHGALGFQTSVVGVF
ncbi:hypothetical protein QN277_012366 [Acacia crassicarpa]|uniref:Uncharacterized protein n=1 Tax=Acacia crassicarpa TaxID=499986 RepID=A0AAE1TEI3_9FABA|nr:hypothetical protein QN277_012366 [Acacia crassicarpa]